GGSALSKRPLQQQVAETNMLIVPRPNDQGCEFLILVRNVSHFHVGFVTRVAAGLVFENSSASWITVSRHDQALLMKQVRHFAVLRLRTLVPERCSGTLGLRCPVLLDHLRADVDNVAIHVL